MMVFFLYNIRKTSYLLYTLICSNLYKKILMRTTTLFIGILFFFAVKSNAQLGSGWEWASTSTVGTYSPGRQVLDIATDNQQNVYAVGRFMGSLTLGGYTVATIGDGTVNFNIDEDAFVVKYNSAGQVQWLKKFGISVIGSSQVGQVIATDASGNVYIGGSGMSGFTTNNSFLVKYDTDGNLIWSKTNLPLFEVGGINVDSDGNLIVMESNQSSKNIYKIDPVTGNILWTVTNTGVGSNATTTYQDFLDSSGNIYYTCFTSAAGAVTVAGENITTTQTTSFVVSLDTNGNKRWVQQIDNVQVQLGYTIDNNGKSYIQISGGFGGTFQGVSTASYGGNRYLELDSNGILTRNLFASPYKGLFRVKNDAIYGFVAEGGGYNGTLTYGSFSFPVPLNNKNGLGIVIKYDKNNDSVLWANSFSFVGDSAFSFGKLLTIETTANNKIIVGGLYTASVGFGTNTYTIASLSGIYPRDLFIAQGSSETLSTNNFSINSMVLYPNPATNTVNFKVNSPMKLRISNLLGQILIQRNISETDSSLDISPLNKGTYIVCLTNSNGKESNYKLLKN
jgi:hypothetical protein